MKKKPKSSAKGYDQCKKKPKFKKLRKHDKSKNPNDIDPPDFYRGSQRYIACCIANTQFFRTKGNLIEAVSRGFLGLYQKLISDKEKVRLLDQWEDDGERLLVLKGIDHDHLEYLANELRFVASDMFPLYRVRGMTKVMIVLSVLGREDNLEELLEGLNILK